MIFIRRVFIISLPIVLYVLIPAILFGLSASEERKATDPNSARTILAWEYESNERFEEYFASKDENKTEETDGNEESDPTVLSVEATYYTAECEGCIGITYTGVDVREDITHEGKRIIAVDPDVIPLGTTVIVRTDNGEEFKATTQDIGGDIRGKRIDILVETKPEARRLGRVKATVEVIDDLRPEESGF